jgi:protein-tyrosine phosphatase
VIVLSLLEEHELSHLGAKSLLKELSVKNIQWMRFEIENFGVPKFSQYALLNQNINTVSNDIINGKNILIHCMAGLGRTGMIAALILIKLGIDINQSIKLIRNIRPGSIETEEQEKFVRNFKLI